MDRDFAFDVDQTLENDKARQNILAKEICNAFYADETSSLFASLKKSAKKVTYGQYRELFGLSIRGETAKLAQEVKQLTGIMPTYDRRAYVKR